MSRGLSAPYSVARSFCTTWRRAVLRETCRDVDLQNMKLLQNCGNGPEMPPHVLRNTRPFCSLFALLPLLLLANPSPMTQDFRRPWLVHGVGGSSRGQLYDSHQSPQHEPTHSWLARTGPPTITAAAAALLVTDRRRHVPRRTPAPPRKQLSRTSCALARVSYGGGMWGRYCSEQRRHL